MIDTPTLLIGLGGAGGSIAYEVWKRVPEAEREFVGLHIFDTDRNPDSGLGKPEFKPLWDQGMITQTSPAMSVGECYNAHLAETQVARWFPNGDVVGQKPMTDGAGQVRAVSRLAFLDTMARGDMRQLDAAIEKLLTVRASRGIAAFRVMIVNTLAGGTGSGIFLQVPMYVRHYLETKRGQTNVIIRNVSLMPGLFVNTGTFSDRPQQLQNVLANGYAAIKELDALIVSRNSNIPEADKGFVFPMEMEYVPGSRQAESVGTGPSPYETIFMIDHINGQGKSLQTAGNYVRQAIDAIELQLVSPMEGKINGQLDNFVKSIDNTQGRGRYASMGSASLCYPYQDILRYLSLRWAGHGLDEQWLKVDRLYRRELDEAQTKKKRDPSVEMPALRERYVDILDSIGTGDTADAFFRRIRRSVQIIGKDASGAEQAREKVSVWVNAVTKRIHVEMDRVGALALDRALDSKALRREKDFVEKVLDGLASIERLSASASACIESAASAVTNDVLWQDADAEPYALMNSDAREKAGHRLNTWMLIPGVEKPESVEGMHPVAVRYFLCRALTEVNQRYRACGTESKELRENLDGLRNKYDDPKTPAKETAHDKAMALRSELGWWGKQDKLDAFANMFERDVKLTANLISGWASKSIEHEVLRRIKGVIEGMISDWEGFFSDLENSLRPGLEADIARAERAHEAGNPMELFVLASAEDKRRFWKHVSRDFADEGISPEVCARLYQAHYLKAVAKRDDPEAARRATQSAEDQTRLMFEEHVVAWCADQLKARNELKLDVVSAIRKEWEIGAGTGKSADDWLHTRIEQVRSITEPWLPRLVNAKEASYLKFWGLNSEAAEQMGGVNGKLFQELFAQGGDNPVVTKEFSRFDIKRFKGVFAVSIVDLPGFRTGTGEYWRAYQEMRSKTLSTPGRGMTPHTDKRWDSPACLREMDDKEQNAAIRSLELATLYAVFHDEIDQWRKDGVYRWRYYEGDQPRNLQMFNGMPCEADLIGLYEGLAANYRLVPEICTLAQVAENRARREVKRDFSALPLIQKGGALLDQILDQAQQGGRMGPREERTLTALATSLADEVLACALRFHGMSNPNTAIEAAEAALTGLLGQSKLAGEEDLSDLAANAKSLIQGRPKVWRTLLQKAELLRGKLGADAELDPLVFMG
jgi:hypothetical protein